MTADLTILPVGGGAHLGTLLADVLKEIRRQGVVYQLTGTTTCLEGSWEQITTVARACHEIGRKHSPHVVTMLRIEDDIEGSNDLLASVQAVEELAGEHFNSTPPIPVEVQEAKLTPLPGMSTNLGKESTTRACLQNVIARRPTGWADEAIQLDRHGPPLRASR
jgi:uncharacterized protein (TIGR00106 family)